MSMKYASIRSFIVIMTHWFLNSTYDVKRGSEIAAEFNMFNVTVMFEKT